MGFVFRDGKIFDANHMSLIGGFDEEGMFHFADMFAFYPSEMRNLYMFIDKLVEDGDVVVK